MAIIEHNYSGTEGEVVTIITFGWIAVLSLMSTITIARHVLSTNETLASTSMFF